MARSRSSVLLAVSFALAAHLAIAQDVPPNIGGARLGESNPKTPEISTDELKRLVGSGQVVLLDTRPHLEFSVGHIPGALNVAPKPGMPMSQYTSDVAEIDRLVGGRKDRPLVLYCNGPFCGKSKRVAEDLLAAGYTNVRRYQLGAPVWRALGGVMAIEPDGVRQIFGRDQTAVFVDAREPAEFRKHTLRGARNIPLGDVKAAKDDRRLPMEDHNTRVVVFADSPTNARAVAEAIAREAFHNVSYFEGTFAAIEGATRPAKQRR